MSDQADGLGEASPMPGALNIVAVGASAGGLDALKVLRRYASFSFGAG